MSVPAALQLLTQALQKRKASGQSHVWISPEARGVLRQLFVAQRRPAGSSLPTPKATPAERPNTAKSTGSQGPVAGTEANPKESFSSFAALRESIAPGSRPKTAAPAPAQPKTAETSIEPIIPVSLPAAPPSFTDKSRRLAGVAAEVARATHISALGSLRETMVFATGNPEARFVLVGEAPGAEEERQGEPFVGPAGQLLTRILKAMGLERRDVYITNICKFRPKTEDAYQGSKNRQPTRQEMDLCLPYLQQELEIIRPEVIVALGTTAAHGLLNTDVPVSRLRGSWHDYAGIPVRVTFHPSYLLHREKDADKGLGEKRKCWEDLLQVMEHLKMPISEKQRRFFQV